MNLPPVLESTRLGMLVPVNAEDSPLPLEHTTVTAHAVGPLNTVAVTQRFKNPFSGPVELEYLFPLPHTAAIVDFELRIGSRTIQGDLQEIEQARENYEKARSEGRRAGFTPRAGYYRQQTRRAAEWLTQAHAVGTAAFTCVVVLVELAQATGEAGLSQSAQDAVTALPKPVTAIEKAIVAHLQAPQKGVQTLTTIQTLEDLRLAALLNAALRAPDKLLKSDLGRIYAACLKGSTA
jgi:hypothetical protein